ncbi:MAG TPA: ATP-binding cassette domain-containing protein [Trinickia sp.]|uniref:ATP-binding cassette domain-containing protein n=1 Tax=Trinickia sp. TaxID=2571163 RepID=UPI002C059A25|nr:ATP-binding cassette domain-containing protein [Trinickia sp.]HVW49954.1 ATP-binding cassette domain-containing protein [Trinickia sp.]
MQRTLPIDAEANAPVIDESSLGATRPVPLLQLRGIEKHFGPVQAVAGIDLDIPAGQVTAIVGDNGAGKSVLIKCIAGIHTPDAGEIRWEGRPVHIRNPRDAGELGIEVVYQDLALCDNLDVVQNMFLGRERLRHHMLDEDAMERAAVETLSSLRVTTLRSVRQAVGSLSGGQRQAVAVAKAVMWNSKLVILDEPTAALGVAQTRQVLELVRRLADQGLAVVMISHNLGNVFEVADRLAVLRLGKLVRAGDSSTLDPQRVVELMTLGNVVSATEVSEQRVAETIGAARGQDVAERKTVPGIAPEPPAALLDSGADDASGSAETPEGETQKLIDYARAWRSRLLAGESGVLPVLLGVALIAAIFQFENDRFLSAGNLVNLLVQGAVFMLIGMGAVFVLLLGEMDLSLGYVAGIAATVVTQLVQPSFAWPWWAAIAAALLAAAALGAFEGALVTRLRLPSFVVTLAGLLGFQGVMIQLLGTGGTIPIPDETINDLANGTLSPAGGWSLIAAAVGIYAAGTLLRDRRCRREGLVVAPRAITALKIAGAAAAGGVLGVITNVDRGVPAFPLRGMPWVVPIVFAVLVAWSLLLARTRFGRYVYAIGGNAEAARRAGIDLARLRTLAFVFGALTAGVGGIVYASRLRSISTSFDGGTIVLYVVATAVIGGTSLFGGRGKPLHAVLGGVVIAAIVNGMALLGLPAAIQLMATAVVLLASIFVDVVVRRRGQTAR